jgi:DNA-binding HxlR family transcriptional regulator
MKPKKVCPIQTTLDYIGKKWTLVIVRDLFYGKKRFREFLKANPALSGKVLSERLKQLERDEIIVKGIVSKTPLGIEYSLTARGRKLNKVLYELAMFGVSELRGELASRSCSPEAIESLEKSLNLDTLPQRKPHERLIGR